MTVAAIAISATAPTHCLTGEGTPVTSSGGTVGCGGVASVDIAYTVTGGTAPYTITSPDTTGKIATTDVTFTVAEDEYTTEYSDGTLTAGSTYILGDPDQWALISLPAGLDLEFDGISEIGDKGAAHFSDTNGNLIRPTTRSINFSDMTLWRWYRTSEFTFTLAETSGARADSDAAYAGRLAGGLAPGEEVCTTCDGGVGDLEPVSEHEQTPKDT